MKASSNTDGEHNNSYADKGNDFENEIEPTKTQHRIDSKNKSIDLGTVVVPSKDKASATFSAMHPQPRPDCQGAHGLKDFNEKIKILTCGTCFNEIPQGKDFKGCKLCAATMCLECFESPSISESKKESKHQRRKMNPVDHENKLRDDATFPWTGIVTTI